MADGQGVDTRALRRALLHNWRGVLACVVIGVLAATGWALTRTELFSSQAIGIVTTGPTDNIGLGLAADSFAKSKAAQYKVLADSRTVREDAYRRAGIEPGPGSVQFTNPLDTAQITVTVSRTSARDAARLADAYIEALAESVSAIENQRAPTDTARTDTPESSIKLLLFVEAKEATAPSFPPTTLALAAGGLLGVLGGGLYAVYRMISDRRIRSTRAIEDDFGLSVIGTLPEQNIADGERLVFGRPDASRGERRRADFRTLEAFKELRTNLQFMRPDDPPRAIVITSPQPSEGKSTTAANLAVTLAESGVPTTLIDGDLRRPAVGATFGVIEDVGLTDAIVGRVDIRDVMQEVPGTPLCSVVPAGPIPPNPSELLSSQRLHDVVTSLARERLVIIDAPPLIPVTDAAILATQFDGAILTIRAGETTTDELRKATSILSKVGAQVLGVVINRVPVEKSKSYYYDYYGYGHGDYRYADESRRRSGKKRRSRRSRARGGPNETPDSPSNRTAAGV